VFRLTVVGRTLVPVAMTALTVEVGTPPLQLRGLLKFPSPAAPVHMVWAVLDRGARTLAARARAVPARTADTDLRKCDFI
jgi:hypothetical protein